MIVKEYGIKDNKIMNNIIEEIKYNKAFIENDGTVEQLNEVLNMCGLRESTGEYKYYEVLESCVQDEFFGIGFDIKPPFYKVFHKVTEILHKQPTINQPKMKFGDLVECWDDGGYTKATARFYAYDKRLHRPFLVVEERYWEAFIHQGDSPRLVQFFYAAPIERKKMTVPEIEKELGYLIEVDHE